MKKPEEIKKGLECALCDVPADICGEGCPCWSAYSLAEIRQDEHVSDALAYIQQLEADNAQLHRCIENLTDKLNAANDALPRWIPVEERLPEDGVDVALVIRCMDVSCVRSGWWTSGHMSGFICPGDQSLDGFNVTHWMLLPEPPEEVQKNAD